MIAHLVLAEEKGRGPVLAPKRVMGMTFLRATVFLPPGIKERAILRRLDKAARLIAQAGCRRVLVGEGFSRWESLKAWGLSEVEPSGLCQILAFQLTLAYLEGKGIPPARATVALRGSRVSRPLFQTAIDLAPRVRALVIAVPGEGQSLSAHLRREFGVPILEEGAGYPPDLTLAFSPLAGAPQGAICLYPPINLSHLRILLKEGEWPTEFDPLPLAAALWEGGALNAAELCCTNN